MIKSRRDRRMPLGLDGLEGRNLLSTMASSLAIQGNHIGVVADGIVGNHIGVVSDGIVGQHIGSATDGIVGQHIGTNIVIVLDLNPQPLPPGYVHVPKNEI